MFFEPEDDDIVRKQRLEGPETRLSHEAEAGVVGAALGVVPVGDHGQVEAEAAHDVDPGLPARLFAYLVDFVHRQRETPHRQGRGTCRHQAAAGLDALGQNVGDGGAGPLAHGVGGAAGPDQNKVGLFECDKGFFGSEQCGMGLGLVGRQRHGMADLVAEILAGPG